MIEPTIEPTKLPSIKPNIGISMNAWDTAPKEREQVVTNISLTISFTSSSFFILPIETW